ncbi:MAG: PIN domain-containing protein [Verrucomicrobia bacterium]|jgi:predicted nucleic acid-binding protein|nr:PIN domain-containing protein [Verrucomicrobiota bacterium]
MTVVLDTSALLAHHRDEEGADRVQSLFDDVSIQMLIASITLTEFGRRMLELGANLEETQKILADYKHLLDGVVPIDGAIAMNALALAAQASKRIPMVDSLIAAVACQNQAILVHRDQHFENIPTTLLKMESLHKGLEGL